MTEEELEKQQNENITLAPGTAGTQSKPDKLSENTGYYDGRTVDPIVSVSNEESQWKIDSHRRMRRTTFQARLGRKLDHIHQMTLDNNLRLSAHPTDMLRISVKRDERSRDIISRTLEAMEIMPIIFPKIESIPMRHLEGYRDGNEVIVPSLYMIDQNEYFEIYAPVECKLKPDDLLVRIVYDDVNCPDNPYVLIFQVTEQLATIGYSAIRFYKYFCSLYNEHLPNQIIEEIKSDQKKREILGW